jgi:hypothetical protein
MTMVIEITSGVVVSDYLLVTTSAVDASESALSGILIDLMTPVTTTPVIIYQR